MATEATDYRRRSFVYRKLSGAALADVGGGAAAEIALGSTERDEEQAGLLGLADLSLLPRIGFKGRGALAWLHEQGLTFEDQANRAFVQPDGTMVAVMATTEAMILSGLDGTGDLVDRLERVWSMDKVNGSYPVPRADTHFWFAVIGRYAAAMFAKLCAVDLRSDRFAPAAIAQTSVARSNCVIIRRDLGGVHSFYLLGDSASAEYQWDCLLDAMEEFHGEPVGWAALRKLAAEPASTGQG